MKALEELANISRFYGRNQNFTIGGGGNTSFKNKDRIWVKPSGVFLGSITADGFAELDRVEIRKIMFNDYSENSTAREIQVKNDLLACLINPDSGLRPSVETSLHEAIEYDFVVHMHPFAVNALLCSQEAKSRTFELLGDDILYLEYIDPGYTLSKKVYQELEKYRQRKKHDPKIILLENHGIFVSANSIDEIKAIYSHTLDIISQHFGPLATTNEQELPKEIDEIIAPLLKLNEGAAVKASCDSLIAHFLKKENIQKVMLPLTPDQIVYCKAYPVYLEQFENFEQLQVIHEQYLADHAYPFKVLLVKDVGLFAIDQSEASAELVADVFYDWMKISYYSESFGGPHFLSQEEIDFIDNWEVEHYRRKMANKSN